MKTEQWLLLSPWANWRSEAYLHVATGWRMERKTDISSPLDPATKEAKTHLLGTGGYLIQWNIKTIKTLISVTSILKSHLPGELCLPPSCWRKFLPSLYARERTCEIWCKLRRWDSVILCWHYLLPVELCGIWVGFLEHLKFKLKI